MNEWFHKQKGVEVRAARPLARLLNEQWRVVGGKTPILIIQKQMRRPRQIQTKLNTISTIISHSN